MELKNELKTTFGKVSSAYDEARVSYPDELIAAIVAFGKLKEGAKMVDIGCGSGQATAIFVKHKFNVIGIDISSNLIEIARKKLPTVDFKVGQFEDIKLPNDQFDLVASAQAWHWVNPVIGYKKVHSILKKNGTFALFYYWQDLDSKNQVLLEVANVLAKHVDGKENVRIGFFDRQSPVYYKGITESQLFTNIEKHEYTEEIEFTKEKHHALMMTFSSIQRLPEDKKKIISKELTAAYKNFKEPLKIPFKYVLVIAKKK